MRPLALISHLKDRDVGLVGAAMASVDLDVWEVDTLSGDTLPLVSEVSGIVSFGGQQSVTALSKEPALVREVALLRDALHASTPIFGVCLGAQLLAHAAGGSVIRLDELFADWPLLQRLPAIEGDPVFGGFPHDVPVLEWHRDAIIPPPDAAILADTSGPGCSVFRVGRYAWGSQPHIEADPQGFNHWVSDSVDRTSLLAGGYDPDVFRTTGMRCLSAQGAAAGPVFERFACLVQEIELSRISTVVKG